MRQKDQPDLYDVGRKAKRAKAPTAPDNATHELIALAVACHEARYHEKPVILKRDGATLKRLALSAGKDVVARRLRAFYALDDAYLVERAHPIALLLQYWNGLAAAEKRPSPDQRAAETKAMLERKLRGES